MTEVIRTELHDIRSKVAFFKPLVNLIRIFFKMNFIAYPTVKGVIKTWKTEKFKKKFFSCFFGSPKMITSHSDDF